MRGRQVAVVVLLIGAGPAGLARAGSDCDPIYDEQQARLDRLEEMIRATPPAAPAALEEVFAEAEAVQKRFGFKCFGYYTRGQKLKARLAELRRLPPGEQPAEAAEEPRAAAAPAPAAPVVAPAPAAGSARPAAAPSPGRSVIPSAGAPCPPCPEVTPYSSGEDGMTAAPGRVGFGKSVRVFLEPSFYSFYQSSLSEQEFDTDGGWGTMTIPKQENRQHMVGFGVAPVAIGAEYLADLSRIVDFSAGCSLVFGHQAVEHEVRWMELQPTETDETKSTTLMLLLQFGPHIWLTSSNSVALALKLGGGLYGEWLRAKDDDDDKTEATEVAFLWTFAAQLQVFPISSVSIDVGLRLLHILPHDQEYKYKYEDDHDEKYTYELNSTFLVNLTLGLSVWF